MNILLIEDDLQLGDHVQHVLRQHGHLVHHLADGRSGLICASAEEHDLIILDRMLPNVDGMALVQTLRASGDQTPVLILSALGTVDEKVAGLRAGGDDYMSKPFAMSELVARVEVLGRRTPTGKPMLERRVADLVLDLSTHCVRRGDRRIDVTPREFRVLEYLMRHAERVVTRTMLLEQVWDYHFDPQTNVIDQYMSRLRQKVDSGGTRLIHTVRGVGYTIRSSQ